MKKIKLLFVLVVFLASHSYSQTGINGKVTDASTNEGLIGASIQVEGQTKGVSTDIDGNFSLNDLKPGTYTLKVTYVSYKSQSIKDVVVKPNTVTKLDVKMEEASVNLGTVTVVSQRKTDTEVSMMSTVRSALVVTSGISSQQIGKSLDKDASEVVKRVPGVTIQNDRFIVVRGLNQRYNNVWLNNAATPSSETDVKAFSFDAVPSNMIDNLLVYKSGAPELSAEATGGFIKIFTKNIPDENFFQIEYGAAYNSTSTFKDTYHLPSSNALDYLGLGASSRDIPSSVPSANLTYLPINLRDDYALKFSSNWTPQKYTALPNEKISCVFGSKWKYENGQQLGTITSITYANSYSTKQNMINKTYENIDTVSGKPIYNYDYLTNTFSTDYRLGVLHNWAYLFTNGNKIEFKNIFNQIGSDKSSTTQGWNNNRGSNFLYINNLYSSRTTYSGQLSSTIKTSEKHEGKLELIAGFAYANRLEPDRQNYNYKISDNQYELQLPTVASINELGRLYMTNHEYVYTGGLNYEQKASIFNLKTTLKAGTYSEYKTRSLNERSICYRKDINTNLTDSAINTIPFNNLFTSDYLGQNKVLILDEQTNKPNSYNAANELHALYFAANLPIMKVLNIYLGARGEYNQLLLDGYRDNVNPQHTNNTTFNIFPSLNSSVNLSKNTLIRLAYAKTINRPEFREISSCVYYDFTEKFSITGNPDLKDAYIQNLDLKFEHYPTPAETFSLALFYKNFKAPIEMVSMGGEGNYTFANANFATNYGAEVEVKKSLETIGLTNFTFNLNASYIYSIVDFGNSQSERSRPLQGQSPYVVNTGLFYQNDKLGLSTSLLYNVMGKRILVAAELNQGKVIVPDIWEMPRNVMDFTLNKKVGKKLEIKFGVKDFLAQDFVTQQTYEYTTGVQKEKREATFINKRYNLGRTIQLGIVYKL